MTSISETLSSILSGSINNYVYLEHGIANWINPGLEFPRVGDQIVLQVVPEDPELPLYN